MKISQVISILKKAQKQFGDVDAVLVDAESGHHISIKEIYKTHPNTAEFGCLNRNEPVNGVVISSNFGNAKDLILS